jgi:ATP-dependent Lon protease
VLFPGVIQALQFFEPRYLSLMADCLSADELITMALLQPGWDAAMSDRPKICPIVCVGKVITHAQLDDGRYNLLLMGAKRARIVREMDYEIPYRMAEVELCDETSNLASNESMKIREKVIGQFRSFAARRPQLDEETVDQLLGEALPLGQLIDLVCYSSGAEPVEQQRVLAETDIRQRAELVMSILKKQNEVASSPDQSSIGFPPDFSLN